MKNNKFTKYTFNMLLKEGKIKNNTILNIGNNGYVKYIKGNFYKCDYNTWELGEIIDVKEILKPEFKFEQRIFEVKILGVEFIFNNFNDVISSFSDKKFLLKTNTKYFYEVGKGEFREFLDFKCFLSNVAYYLKPISVFNIFNSEFSVLECYEL